MLIESDETSFPPVTSTPPVAGGFLLAPLESCKIPTDGVLMTEREAHPVQP
jgi:hypothetical protein